MSEHLESVPDVVQVEWLRGSDASRDAPPDLLVEVPHGADRRAHYDRLRSRMRGVLPEDLHCFFHVNTDVGAWQFGQSVAGLVVAARPKSSVLLLRSLIPRTFIDCNRPVDVENAETDAGGDSGKLTPGVPPYVRDAGDLAMLLGLHGRYVDTVRRAFEQTCGRGGIALVPHTYGPRTLGIDGIDEQIVRRLREALAPERVESWPLRAEVDLLTRVGDGPELSPPGIEAELLSAYGDAGFEARANDTYDLHPGSLAHDWSLAYPGQILCVELRRDILVEEWRPFEEMQVDPAKVESAARVLAPVLAARLPQV